nr:MAG TPA: hypothetical protein [Caudoviricetes sp.]
MSLFLSVFYYKTSKVVSKTLLGPFIDICVHYLRSLLRDF